ncbi:MAG: hypothetical protein H0V04_04985, partial [Chloroflexi bacterium]|nr:hypothetical protein [Chloroflexota bacterium]
MHPPRGSRPALPRLASRLAAALALAAALLLPAASPAMAAGVTISAEPLLAGHVRPGAWAGVRVHLENDGPLVDGELRISGSQQGRSTFGVAVQLATGASQDHILYGQPGFFGGRFVITLVSGGATVATQDVSVTAHDAYTPTTFIVAERPEGILADIRRGATVPQSNAPVVVSIGTDDLPERIEAWAAVDRLVWQDVDSSRLSRDQLTALRTWVSAGGRLTIVGGTTATTTLGAFPAEIFPFTPDRTVDASPTDLASLLGTLPVGASA